MDSTSAKIKKLKAEIQAELKEQETSSKCSDGLPVEKNEFVLLQEDLQRRQESYVRRERGYKEEITRLKLLLERSKGGGSEAVEVQPAEEKLESIHELHSKLLSSIDHVQTNTSKILQEQERDLLRAFRARLFDIQSELEAEKRKQSQGASVWIEKNKQLEKDLNWAREMADRLEQVNQTLQKDTSKLRSQFKSQEDDREFLIRQLVSVKKDNARLREDLRKSLEKSKELEVKVMNLEEERRKKAYRNIVPPSDSPTSLPKVHSFATGEFKYQEIIKRLKRLLAVERKNLQQVRNKYVEDLQHRTELEEFLNDALDDVKQAIEKEISPSQERVCPQSPSEFGPEERNKVLEMLLSKERVVSLLYHKTFPRRRDKSMKKSSSEQILKHRGKKLTNREIETMFLSK